MLLTLALGFWQLSRAAEKQALQATIDARRAQPELDASAFAVALAGADAVARASVLYRTVRLRGTWLDPHTVFLDNRQMAGKPGFFVVTPLRLENSPVAVLVQRGWVQRDFTDRAQVPKVTSQAGLAEITGRIAPPPSKLYEFAPSAAGAIRQNLDLPDFSREINMPLAALSVLQTGPPGDGLGRDWLVVNTGVEKHYGYAFQWFALCGLIALLYGWFQIVRRFFPSR